MTSLSTHVLDIERGLPAAGVPIRLYHAERELARGSTNADGRVLDVAGVALAPGVYRLVFDTAAYFAASGRPAAFVQALSIDFRIDAATPHYHVPLLLSASSCTSYRGS